jgi:hypothetical protein
MARGGAQAQPAPLRQWSTRSKEHGRHGARPVRLASIAKGGSCWPPTHGTRPSSRPRALRAGDPGPGHAARGFRFRNAPRLLAASLSLKTPERIRARLMGMTIGLLLSAALESRIRKALQDHGATFPNQQGLPVQPPPLGGLSRVCGDSRAPHPRAVASGAASHRGASAVAQTPWNT